MDTQPWPQKTFWGVLKSCVCLSLYTIEVEYFLQLAFDYTSFDNQKGIWFDKVAVYGVPKVYVLNSYK